MRADAGRFLARVLARLPPAASGWEPGEIAAFASWLVGPENTYMSGSNLVIDGGLVRV